MLVRCINLLLFSLIGFAGTAAAMEISTYEKQRNEAPSSPGRGLLKIYLTGVGEGFKWSNAALAQQKQPMLFCAPEQISLNAENFMQIVDEALSANREPLIRMELPVEAILLRGLQQRLSCPAR